MKVTLIAAISKDGFINHRVDEQASEWTSPEDQAYYSALLKRYKLQFMGRKTYEAYKARFKRSSLYRRIIRTNNPELYKAVPGKLEFTDDPLSALITRLEQEGFRHAALLGGSEVFTEFLDAGLVDEAYVTVEPVQFGSGVPFLLQNKTMADYPSLTVDSTTPLNASGTMLVHYVRTEMAW